MSKTTDLLDQAQPYLRDQYEGIRREVGPRLAHTRDAAVPLAVDVSHKAWDLSNKVRSEYLPVATKRAALAAAALRGAEMDHARERQTRWKLVAAATAAGAAVGAGAMMMLRKRHHEAWYEEPSEDTKQADTEMRADPPDHHHEHHDHEHHEHQHH